MNDTPTNEAVRAEVRQWLADNWDPALERTDWSRRVFDAGWAAPSWEPQWGGRGLTDPQSRIVAAEFAHVGARGTGQDRSDLLACTIHDLGTEEQKQRLIPPSVRGETRWCLLYSEPGAGSGPRRVADPRRPRRGGLDRQRTEGLDVFSPRPPTTDC